MLAVQQGTTIREVEAMPADEFAEIVALNNIEPFIGQTSTHYYAALIATLFSSAHGVKSAAMADYTISQLLKEATTEDVGDKIKRMFGV